MPESARATTYTDADRVSTLAALDLNAGNVTRTSKQTGVSRLTIRTWRDLALTAGDQLVTSPVTTEKKPKRDWADLYGRAATLGAMLITKNLRRYRYLELKPSELRDVAVIAGIAVDKHLDYRDGRKAGVMVDQSQNLNLPPGTTLDELRALRDGLKQ
jgi:hypothetical protein